MKKLKIIFKYRWIAMFVIIWILIYQSINRLELVREIQRALPSREAGLLAGMVWGEKRGISSDFYKLLINTGLIHIVVVSGANLMIVGRNLIELLAKILGRKKAIAGGAGVILIYVNSIGWQIPIIRAVLFLSVYYLAQILGRQFNKKRAIVLVGLLMTMADVGVLRDVSFWLSMAAFVAITLNQRGGIIKNTVWVSLFVLPILSISFGKISLFTPITNIAVLFLVEILTVMGLIGSLTMTVCHDLGMVILAITYPLLRYLIEMVEKIGGIGGVINFKFNWWMLVGWYLMIGGYWYEKKTV
ncbi:MAG: ComEC/Rec2 family competence protein [Candidatus Shapirobacteria bacterium]